MRFIFWLLCLIPALGNAQIDEYMSKNTIIGDLKDDKPVYIKETVYITINKKNSVITLDFLSSQEKTHMKFDYISARIESGKEIYVLDPNKWSVDQIVLAYLESGIGLTFFYKAPNTSYFLFGPLTKQ